MCGCFEINFNFIETFNYSDNENYIKSDDYICFNNINEKNKISIQHLLLVGMGKNKSIIKHWRQDWLYQNTHLYEFVGDRVWESINL